MTVLDEAAKRLRAAGVGSARAEARLLLAHAMGVSREALVAGTVVPDAAALERFERAVARRASREPFAYIVGRREFFSLEFEVGPGVLIPRPETELLVEQALRRFPARDEKLRVLDLGTGTGCLLLSFLHERPTADGLGIDASDAALAWAERNAERLGLSARARFLRGDWCESHSSRFNIVFANPPYVRSGDIASLDPEVRAHEPARALDGGADGLDAYRRIAKTLADVLSPEGAGFVEIGEGQAEAVSSIFKASNVSVDGIVTDLAGIPRCFIMVAAAQHSSAN